MEGSWIQSEDRLRGLKYVKIFSLSVWKDGLAIYQEQIRENQVGGAGRIAAQFWILLSSRCLLDFQVTVLKRQVDIQVSNSGASFGLEFCS